MFAESNALEMELLTIYCPPEVPEGSSINKDSRHELFGQVAGGAGSRGPEDFQRRMIIQGTGTPCPKTNTRINLRKNTLVSMAHPNVREDGYEYSEDFDGLQNFEGKTVYLNLKCIVGKGGSQTRSLREVYWHIEGQLRYLLSSQQDSIYFANILDGDEAHANMNKFQYLVNLPEFQGVRQKIYVGDLRGYFTWLQEKIVDVE